MRLPPSMDAHRTDPAVVAWTYRLILGREPESDEIVDGWARNCAPAELRDAFLSSAEMSELLALGLPLRLAADPAPGGGLEEAAFAALTLERGEEPSAEEAAGLARRARGVPALRRHLLSRPAIARALRRAEPDTGHRVVLGGRPVSLRGGVEEPSLRPLAPRFAWLGEVAQAALPEAGEGAVLVDGEADLGAASVALALAAPRFAALRAFEDDPARAAHLVANLGAHAGPRAKAAAVALPPLAALGTGRADLLRLPSPERLEEAAEWMAAGTLVLVPLRLREELRPGRPSPAALLAGWCARWAAPPVALAWPAPFALEGEADIARALDAALDDPERRLDLALGGAEGWAARYRSTSSMASPKAATPSASRSPSPSIPAR